MPVTASKTAVVTALALTTLFAPLPAFSAAGGACESWTSTETGKTEHEARQRATIASNTKFNTWKMGLQTLDRYPVAADLNAVIDKGKLDMAVTCKADLSCTAVKSWCPGK